MPKRVRVEKEEFYAAIRKMINAKRVPLVKIKKSKKSTKPAR